MAVKNIVAKGIGFSPSSVKFIPVHGFLAGVAGSTIQCGILVMRSTRR